MIVNIDDTTIERLHLKSLGGVLPRSYHAKLVTGLEAAGAKVALFDLFFTDQSGEDATFRNALSTIDKMAVVLPIEPSVKRGEEKEAKIATKFRLPVVLPLQLPDSVFLASDVPWDPDDIVRGAQALVYNQQIEGTVYYHSALVSYLAEHGFRPGSLVLGNGNLKSPIGVWPLGETNEYRIRWSGRSYREYEFSEALEMLANREKANTFKDAIVIIDALNQAQRSNDIHATSIGTLTGGEVIASTIDSLSMPPNRQVRESSSTGISFFACVLSTLLALLSSTPGILRTLGSLGLGLVGAYGWPLIQLQWLSISYPVVEPFIATVFAVTLTVVISGSRFRNLAIRYLPTHIRLGWQSRKPERAAILFVDVEDSTPIVGGLDHAAGARFLTEVHNDIVTAVEWSKGVIERSMGDGALILFKNASDADLAIQCATLMLNIHQRIQKRQDFYLREFKVGPTLNIGAELGTVSGEILQPGHREEWSSFGVDIHLANRIQTASKAFEFRMAVGPAMAEQIGSSFDLGPATSFDLKGIGERAVYPLRPA